MEYLIISLFISFFAVMLLEVFLSATWNKTYFTKGIAIYIATINNNKSYSANEIAERLPYYLEKNKQFDNMKISQLDGTAFGFREKLIDFSMFKMRYTPLMHGSITICKAKNIIYIKGILNWSIIVFLVLWYSMSIGAQFENTRQQLLTRIILIFAPIFVTGLTYLVQRSKYKAIASIITDKIK